MNTAEQQPRLTQYSHGAGCGCKIAPRVLEEILSGQLEFSGQHQLLVGNSSKDDAAVYDLGNGSALLSTTDFFMPIVDSPFDFGRIAAANAISDVYAMGGTPLMAVAILGWPVEKLPLDWARQIIEGGRHCCAAAGIPLAGGHSIDTTEPIFGLAVSGIMPVSHLKRNSTARKDDLIFLTKPLGVGILSTALKRGLLEEAHAAAMVHQMAALNRCGEALGGIPGVSAMTDVTGFGLLGHLLEMAEGSGLGATISYAAIPLVEGLSTYLAQRITPDATSRNWSAYGTKVSFEKGVNVLEAFSVLPDPQTNGGLLFSVAPEAVAEVQEVLRKYELEKHVQPIGRFVEPGDKRITVIP